MLRTYFAFNFIVKTYNINVYPLLSHYSYKGGYKDNFSLVME